MDGKVRIIRARQWLAFLLGAVLFGVAYTQPCLYYSNQNQYFLHGLAWGGLGFLDNDWLANTADPTPFFSVLVALTYRYLHPVVFYLYYVLLLGIYFHALVRIFDYLSRDRSTFLSRFAFLALLLALHSGLLRWLSAQLFGVDYPWYFQAGVANQYVLGAGLQPSVFGVLLILSVSIFLADRPLLAVTASSLGAVMHSTYLLAAALLTLSYLILLCRRRGVREALFVALWALFLVVPVLLYNVHTFAPTTFEMFADAQHLLAHFRIPHHAEVDRWLDGIAWGQIGWIVVALVLVRDGRLFVILLTVFLSSAVLTLVQLGTGNDSLALLFPWRSSAILVPIATTVVLTRMVHGIARWLPSPSRWWTLASAGGLVSMLLLFVIGGVVISFLHLGYRTNQQELPLLEYIRDHKSQGDVYLLPIEVPRLTAGKRGAASLNFTPPPRRDSQKQNISVDLQQFRLFTGAPIYVDFKSIPYKDVEVLEWQQRIRWNDELYQEHDWNNRAIKTELRNAGITHVVTAVDRDVECDALQLLYEDDFYRLYRLWLP